MTKKGIVIRLVVFPLCVGVWAGGTGWIAFVLARCTPFPLFVGITVTWLALGIACAATLLEWYYREN